MQASETSTRSLWSALESAGSLQQRFLYSPAERICFADLANGSTLKGRTRELGGRSVLIATNDQLSAALAMLELDGVARRLILCPSDVSREHLPFILETAEAEAVVCTTGDSGIPASGSTELFECAAEIAPASVDREPSVRTEWILLTSGTTGRPKLVAHTLESLVGAIRRGTPAAEPTTWATFYDIRRYGGLQVFLRAVLTSSSMVLSDPQESPTEFLDRCGTHGVTHILGTPSHWRRAVMSPAIQRIRPRYARLSGEIVDQAILNHLRECYPGARVAHAFASTEAGVAFEVNDGLAGFPREVVGNHETGVEVKVQDGSLRIRSNRTASRYLGNEADLKDADGFVDTRDVVELRGDRYYFAGRRDGVINVGGFKVHPEEVEAILNRHPQVRMSLVRQKKNPITGAVVVADIVLDQAAQDMAGHTDQVKRELLQLCHNHLPGHKVPAAMNFVPELSVAATGKIARHNA